MKMRLSISSFLLISCISIQVDAADNSAKSALQQLTPYAPDSTELVSIVRHGLLTKNKTIRQGIEGAISFAAAELPIPLDEFDEFFVLLNPSQRAEQTFEAAASQLDSTDGTANAEKQPIDHFAGLIRFKNPIEWSKIESLLATAGAHESNARFASVTQALESDIDQEEAATLESKSTTYHLVKWRGKEFLYTKSENSPCALRVDDRSFIICNYHQLREGLAGKATNDEWYNSVSEDDLRGDVVTVVNTESNAQLVKTGPLALLQKTKTVIVRLDLADSTLASVQLFFENEDSAQSFVDAVKGMHGLSKATIREQLEANIAARGEDDGAAWLAGQFDSIYGSFQFDRSDATATIEVPRPAEFDKLVEEFAGVVKREQLAAQKGLADADQQLQEAADAAAEEATKSLEVKSVDQN